MGCAGHVSVATWPVRDLGPNLITVANTTLRQASETIHMHNFEHLPWIAIVNHSMIDLRPVPLPESTNLTQVVLQEHAPWAV